MFNYDETKGKYTEKELLKMSLSEVLEAVPEFKKDYNQMIAAARHNAVKKAVEGYRKNTINLLAIKGVVLPKWLKDSILSGESIQDFKMKHSDKFQKVTV